MNLIKTKMRIKKIARFSLKPLAPLIDKISPGNNFAISHLGRCGSAVLGQLLKQHPQIYWGSELYSPIFKKWQDNNNGEEKIENMPDDALKILRDDMLMALHRQYGYSIKPFHFSLISYSLESYLNHLDSLNYSRFVVLDRNNRLRKIVSSMIMHQYQIGHIEKKSRPKKKKVSINLNSIKIDFDNKPLIEYLIDYDKQFKSLRKALSARDVIYLTYENDIEVDPKKAYKKICNFLNLNPLPVKVKFSKTNPFALKEMIENFAEVEEALCNTPYEWMLYK